MIRLPDFVMQPEERGQHAQALHFRTAAAAGK